MGFVSPPSMGSAMIEMPRHDPITEESVSLR
jgi:hypothetical protein